AGRPGTSTEHRRLAALDTEHLDLGQTGAAQQRGDLVGAGPDLRCRGRVRRHRRDPDEPLQVGAHGRKDPGDGRPQPLDDGTVRVHGLARYRASRRSHAAYNCRPAAKRSAISMVFESSGWRTITMPSEMLVAR